MSGVTTINVRAIPVRLWRRVKALASELGITLQRAVVEALSDWVNKREREP